MCNKLITKNTIFYTISFWLLLLALFFSLSRELCARVLRWMYSVFTIQCWFTNTRTRWLVVVSVIVYTYFVSSPRACVCQYRTQVFKANVSQSSVFVVRTYIFADSIYVYENKWTYGHRISLYFAFTELGSRCASSTGRSVNVGTYWAPSRFKFLFCFVFLFYNPIYVCF